MDSNSTQVINVDLDKLWEPAAVGLRRAYVFAGLGVNAARDSALTTFHLPGLLKISFVPQIVSAETSAEYKREFEKWILGNSFREVIEAFSVSLDNTFYAGALVKLAKMKETVSLSKFRKFHRAGVEGKLQMLEDQFDIRTDAASYFESLNHARNCLSHRMGKVGLGDCNEPGKLVVRYKRVESLFIDENKNEEVVPVDSIDSYTTRANGVLAIRFVEAQKEFAVGTMLILEPEDVRYILYTISESGLELKSAVLSLYQQLGVQVVTKST